MGSDCLLATSCLAFSAERLIDKAEVLVDDAWAMISRISSLDEGSAGDDHVFVGGCVSSSRFRMPSPGVSEIDDGSLRSETDRDSNSFQGSLGVVGSV